MAKRRQSLHFDENQQEQILEWAAVGISLVDISKSLGLSPWEFMKYREDNPFFADRFNFARLSSAEVLADSLIPTAQNESVHPGITRNVLDATRWLASKRNPKAYGEKLDLNVNQAVDISSILDAAAKRAEITEREVIAIEGEVADGFEDLL